MKRNAEETEDVAVSSLDVNESLNQGLPLLDHRAQLVRRDGHPVEICQAGLALDLIYAQTELAEGNILALGVEVSKGHLEDTSTQTVLCVLQALGAVHEGLSHVANIEHGWCLDVVPVLAGEGIHDLLLKTFLSLGQTFIFAYSLV